MTGTFTIEAGQHHCRPRYPYIFHGSEMSRVVRFDASCIYKGLPDSKEPVNKMFGFCELWPSVGNWIAGNEERKALHHYHSARFGWNCDEKGQLWLYGYSYADGIRETKRICQVYAETDIKCSINVDIVDLSEKKDWYGYCVKLPTGYGYTKYNMPAKRSPSGSRAFGYGLFSYFGGTSPSPHKMKISLSRP